jgi:hypothetical protein
LRFPRALNLTKWILKTLDLSNHGQLNAKAFLTLRAIGISTGLRFLEPTSQDFSSRPVAVEALPPPQWDDVAAPSGTQASLGGLDTRRAAGGQDLVATRSARRRGPKAKKLSQTIEAMRHDIQQGRRSVEQLRDIREKTLSEDYRVSRDTARKARSALLSEFNSRQTPTNDK